jgi:lysophospholipase L1-like esterase
MGVVPAIYACGVEQGTNCSMSYVCHPGPLPYDAKGKPVVMVLGDSVSLGWTPQLKIMVQNNSFVTHSPAAGDGGARSTTNAVQCIDYFLATSTMQPLNLTAKDSIVFNFGLHDYNLGLRGVDEYVSELTTIVKHLQATGAKLVWAATTPAHQNTVDDATVQALNEKANEVMQKQTPAIPVVDLYSAVMAKCGPVPFQDTGDKACSLCAPNCKGLSVHYSKPGYQFISSLVAAKLKSMPHAVVESSSSSMPHADSSAVARVLPKPKPDPVPC